jgi:K+-transporting ATPase ATPase C chain
MTILTGIIYTFFMTGIAQLAFNKKANGSLVVNDGKTIGSVLIGQRFDSSIYFWTRPSAIGYNPVPSGASNYGPTSDTLKKQVLTRRKNFASMNSLSDTASIPDEMLFASASGLDPHISPEAALMQVDRVVKARNYDERQRTVVINLIKTMIIEPQFHLLGDRRINVLELNIALDKLGIDKPDNK